MPGARQLPLQPTRRPCGIRAGLWTRWTIDCGPGGLVGSLQQAAVLDGGAEDIAHRQVAVGQVVEGVAAGRGAVELDGQGLEGVDVVVPQGALEADGA